MKLYYHQTDGGAEYLYDTFIKWKHNCRSGKEGVSKNAKIIVRIDGDITKDAEINIKDNGICPACGFNTLGLTNKQLKN